MKQQAYEVVILKHTPIEGPANSIDYATTLVMLPTVFIANTVDSARNLAARKLSEKDAADMMLLEFKIRQF